LLLSELLEALADHQVHGEIVRVVDLNIKAGVSSDEGDGDDSLESRGDAGFRGRPAGVMATIHR
jgi:hypothetical protein